MILHCTYSNIYSSTISYRLEKQLKELEDKTNIENGQLIKAHEEDKRKLEEEYKAQIDKAKKEKTDEETKLKSMEETKKDMEKYERDKEYYQEK